MSVIKTIGGEAGRDYATPQLFIAAWGIDPDLPTVQIENVIAEIYGANSDGSAGEYSGQITLPTVGSNNYNLTFKGMLGSISAGGQVRIASTTNGFYNNNGVYAGDSVTYKNLSIVSTGSSHTAIYEYGTQHAKIIGCTIEAEYSAVFCRSNGLICDSFITAGHACVISDYSVYNNSVFYCPDGWAIRPSYALACAYFTNCTVYSKYVARKGGSLSDLLQDLHIVNTIIAYTSNFSDYPNVESLWTGNAAETFHIGSWRNALIYKTDGTFIAGLTLTEAFEKYPEVIDHANLYSAAPQFINANGDYSELSDFALEVTSPCLPYNQTAIIDTLTGEAMQPSPIGAMVPLAVMPDASIVKNNEPFNVDSTGTYVPSLTLPTAGTLTITDNADGESGTVAISGTDQTATNTVYASPYGTDSWTEIASITGNDSTSVGFEPGAYWAYAAPESSEGVPGENSGVIYYRQMPLVADSDTIVVLAESITSELASASFSMSVTVDREYDHLMDYTNISGTMLLVSPKSREIEKANRAGDINDYLIDVSILHQSPDHDTTDELLMLSDELYLFFRDKKFDEFDVVAVDRPELYNTTELNSGLFVSTNTITLRGIF